MVWVREPLPDIAFGGELAGLTKDVFPCDQITMETHKVKVYLVEGRQLYLLAGSLPNCDCPASLHQSQSCLACLLPEGIMGLEDTQPAELSYCI